MEGIEGIEGIGGEARGVGRTEEVVDRASAALAGAMLATLDRDPRAINEA